jgi:hypothetical protein
MSATPRIAVVAAVNDAHVLRGNLARSPVIAEGLWPLYTEEGHANAASAYNAGLRVAAANVVVFAHQDVYLPRGWDQRLLAAITSLESTKPSWAVLGVIGVKAHGALVGRSWSSGLGRSVGSPLADPTPVVSLDEVVLVLNATKWVRFDDRLPGYHLYGTDIVQTALSAGLGAYAFDGPVIHNSVEIKQLGSAYRVAYRHVQKKWRARLPIPTTVVQLTRSPWPLIHNWMHGVRAALTRRAAWRTRCDDPVALSESLGFAVG